MLAEDFVVCRRCEDEVIQRMGVAPGPRVHTEATREGGNSDHIKNGVIR